MYQRSAIVLEKYFNKLFGHDQKYNLKDNFLKYSRLVECSANYKVATDSEDKIMQEYDEIANRIKNIQKKQEILSEKNEKFQDERNTIFQSIAEEPEIIKKNIENVDKNIEEINSEIKQNEQDFINVISNFSEKSEIRNNLGKERKNVESDYSNALNEALELYKHIDKEKLQNAKNYNDNCAKIEQELNQKMKENGDKERVPFDSNVIKSAIQLEINIQKKEIEILYSIYEKTGRLFLEIKNNNIKIERHKKIIKDCNAKMDFLDALKEYLVQFLDNERVTAVNGQIEHKKQMKEACKNFEEDLIQINNMYELLLREISAKANKKMYKELYNVKYLKNLEKQADNFEIEISKLNLLGTIIDPNHWRLEGMKKIYNSFYKTVTEVYERNLAEFDIVDKEENKTNKKLIDIETISENKPEQKKENILNEKDSYLSQIKNNIDISEEYIEHNNVNDILDEDIKNEYIEDDEDDEEDEFDERIDMILGFNKKDKNTSDNKKETSKIEKDNEPFDGDETEDSFWDDDNNGDDDFEESDYWDEDNDKEEYEDDLEDDFDEYEDDFEDDDLGGENEEKRKYNKVSKDDDEDDDDDDDEIFDDREDDDPWADDEIQDIKNIKTNRKNNYIIDTKNKKTKGKHDKNGEKPKGLLGKFMK